MTLFLVMQPQTLSNESLYDKCAFTGVNIWRGVNTLFPAKPTQFQMVRMLFKFDLGGQSTWPGKHNTFKGVFKHRVVHTPLLKLQVTLPNPFRTRQQDFVVLLPIRPTMRDPLLGPLGHTDYLHPHPTPTHHALKTAW